MSRDAEYAVLARLGITSYRFLGVPYALPFGVFPLQLSIGRSNCSRIRRTRDVSRRQHVTPAVDYAFAPCIPCSATTRGKVSSARQTVAREWRNGYTDANRRQEECVSSNVRVWKKLSESWCQYIDYNYNLYNYDWLITLLFPNGITKTSVSCCVSAKGT